MTVPSQFTESVCNIITIKSNIIILFQIKKKAMAVIIGLLNLDISIMRYLL